MTEQAPHTPERPRHSGPLTHTQFYQLCELCKVHRDGISQCGSWKAALAFLRGKAGQLPVSEHALQDACGAVEITLCGEKPRGGRPAGSRARSNSHDAHAKIEILTRAVAALYTELGMPQTVGIQRLLALARREKAEAKESQGCADSTD